MAENRKHPTQGDDARLPDQERDNAHLILRMMKIAWRFKWGALWIVLLQSILLAMALSGLGLTGLGIDVIRESFDPKAQPASWPLGIAPPQDWSAMSRVGTIAAAVFIIAALRFFLDRTATVQKQVLVQKIIVHMRSTVYNKLQRLSFRFFDANESGSLINRVSGDVQAVRRFIDGVLVEVLMLVLSLAFFLTYMVKIHAWLTFWCLLTTPVLWVITVIFSRLVKPAYRRNRQLFDKAVLVLSENIQGVQVVKGFSRQDDEIDKFARANAAVSDQKNWIFWRVSSFVPGISLITQVNLVILLMYGGYLFMHYDPGAGIGIPLGGGLVVFSVLLQQFSSQVGNIAQIANAMQASLTGAARVFEVLDMPVTIQSPPDAVKLPRAKGAVRFDGVTFYYKDGSPALEHVNLEAKAGECIAVLGATGAGKSTLLSLIARFYDPQHGYVLVDGIDLRRYDVDDLRRNIGLVFQESFLFSNTVAMNIAFGHPEATREQIERAAGIAAAHDFVTQLPKGYDTLLTEGGANLSGGQRQRLAIARAVLLDPAILLLDDPTASIDPETENDILVAMNQAMSGRTTFVVAHRLSTLRRADRVIVLDKGRVTQVGTHEELISSGGHYQRAAELQTADHESRRLLGITTGDVA